MTSFMISSPCLLFLKWVVLSCLKLLSGFAFITAYYMNTNKTKQNSLAFLSVANVMIMKVMGFLWSFAAFAGNCSRYHI